MRKADELVGIQCHRLLPAAATIILPPEANLAILDIKDTLLEMATRCV